MGRFEGRTPVSASLSDFLAWLEQAPAGTTIPATSLLATLGAFASPATPADAVTAEASANTWRERLWTCTAETRLGVREAAESLGRPVSFVYRHTSAKLKGGSRLPHRRLAGELVFIAGELRSWMAEHEEVIAKGRLVPMPVVLASRRAS